jgi:hypothetical protein
MASPGTANYLAGRGLSAAAAWATVSVAVVPLAFLLAAGLRRLPGSGE